MLKITPVGAIDIGSNAIRLQITNIEHYQKERVLKKVTWVRVPLRLGEDVFSVGAIGDAKLLKLEEVMHSFWYMMKAFNVQTYRACATSAMREASNSALVIETIKERTGIEIEVIDGAQEADIILEGGLAEIVSGVDKNYLFVDVGGGSTELTVFSGGKRVDSRSFPLGTVRILSGSVDKSSWDDMRKWVKYQSLRTSSMVVVGSGGNISKVVRMLGKKESQPISYTELKVLYDYIDSFSLEERIHQLRLNPHRADVIAPALKIFLTVMKTAKIDQVITPKMGVVEGITRILYNDCR